MAHLSILVVEVIVVEMFSCLIVTEMWRNMDA